MRIFVDITNVYSKKQKYAMNLVSKLEQVRHPNILNLLEPVMLIDEIQTLVFKTESPDHISTWKQFCKYEFSIPQVLSFFRQLASGIAHLHDLGIIHRDVHPTRIHFSNGLVKFNLIGLPYNFKKLLKCTNYSGHVNYSAPEIISESEMAGSLNSTADDDYVGEGNFTEKSETWSLGCCLYYLVTKMDPFEGASVKETKQNIQKLKLNRPSEPLDPVVNSIVMKCFERDPAKRVDVKGLIRFQDSIEVVNYGDTISLLDFERVYAESLAKSEVQNRVEYDVKNVDYSNKSLDLRNNPWFFSKSYSYTERPKNGIYSS